MTDAIELADQIESLLLEVANGERKPAKLPLEPFVRACQMLRELSKPATVAHGRPHSERIAELERDPKRKEALDNARATLTATVAQGDEREQTRYSDYQKFRRDEYTAFARWLADDEKINGCRGLSTLEIDQMRDAWWARAAMSAQGGGK